MSDNELLLALSYMMDTKFKPVNDRLDRMEQRQESIEQSHGRLEQSFERLEQSFERLEQSFEKQEQSFERLEQSFEKQEQSQKRMELTLENNILPRLQTIEECYLSTFERYQSGIGQIETMQSNIDVLTTTVKKHSEMFQQMA